MLIVVLFMIALLALLAATYSFMVRAHVSGVMERKRQYEARLAADAGLQHAIVTLRTTRGSVDSWYNNPEAFQGAPYRGIEGEDAEQRYQPRSEDGLYDPNAKSVVRYNLYAPNFDEPDRPRFGITDECARLDINVATESQLRTLFTLVIPQEADAATNVDINVLVDSLMDWIDSDTNPRPNGAENEHYTTLIPPYACKQGRLSTVEELLLIRGFTAWVVYGEDYNRNSLLDPNEDDGSASFPPDNADGLLFRGVSPYLTVWSRDTNTSGDNRARININMQDTQKLQERLEGEIDGDLIDYIIRIRSAGISFNSVMNLLPAPPAPEEEEPPPDDGQNPPDDAQNPPETEEPPPSTQPAGNDSTSQPSGEFQSDDRGDSSDQRSNSRGSENRGPTSRPTAPVFRNLTDEEPPGTYEDLPLILDRLTVDPSPSQAGRINVSTAPREVIATIDELTEADVDALVAVRQTLAPEDKSTPAWLVTSGVLDEYTFRRILDKVTTKSNIFRIEAVGFGDHIGTIERHLTVLEMRGPIPQVLYYRNLNPLGTAYMPHGDETRGPADRSAR